jgi:phenylacetate-CoA ligase
MGTETDLQHQYFDMLMDSQWWSAEQLRNYQRSQLGHLLRHAKKTVPFYEHRLDAVLKPNGDIDWDRWSEIPIVTRKDMVEHREAMQTRELPAGHGPTAVFQTSGSSGAAISITSTALLTVANQALRWRCHVWNDLDWTKTLCVRDGTDPVVASAPDGLPIGAWGPDWDVVAQTGRAWLINKLVPASETLAFVARRRASYLHAGPKTARAFALEAQRMGLNVSIDAILCQGANADELDRQYCREAFGARLIEHYSSKESGQIAHPCDAGSLHENAECVLVEIVGEDGQPVPAGQIGRVVVTPFFSTAQPLIRYEQGDRAAHLGACTCGRHLPVLSAVDGRHIAVFSHPDGRRLAQVLPIDAYRLLDCAFLQIAQVGSNDYEARYVPKTLHAASDADGFVRVFRDAFFSDARVVLKRLTEAPLTSDGKMREYVNEWDGNS